MSSQQGEQPDLASLVQAFGLAGADHASLTPFARVHRARTADGAEVVLKRTATRTAQPLATWTRALADHGVAVVSPASLEAPNPQQIGDEEWWVIYPYVSGKVYRGELEQIEEAGALLGRLHAAPVDVALLRPYRWPTPDDAEVTQECETIEENFARYAPEAREASMTAVRDLGRRWSAGTVQTLRDADLPLVGVSSDYKASNLVFTDSGPVLVDPDNGGLEPRILDLALALVLFHNECASAPARLFDGREWGTFFSGYRCHVDLTDAERRLWPLALEHMLWDEGTWVLEDPDQLDWSDPRQRDFMIALAQAWPGGVDRLTSLAARFPLS